MASAILRFRIDGGALQSSSVSDTPANLAGKSVALVATSYAGWQTARWMIAEYPAGFECPDGWSTDSGGIYYYIADPISGITPPAFALPSSGDVDNGQWGKLEFRLLVNGKVYSTKIGIEILSPNGLHDLAFGEEAEFGGAQRQWVEDQKTNLRTFEGALNGGAPVDAQYLLGAANGALPSAVVWTTIGTTIGFASTSTIPCSFTRTSSTTNAAIDTMKIASVCSGSAANNFGVACLYQAAAKDVGRIKFIFTDITGSSEDSQFVVQLRTAGAALADAFLLSGTALQVAALAGLGSGYVSVDNAGNLSVGPGGSGAPDDAPYLTVGAVSGLSNEVDITALASTAAFASSSVVPISTTRAGSTTNTFVDVMLFATTTSGTAAANYGPSALFKSEDASGSLADIGRAAFVWSDANSLSAASKFLIQLRLAGDGLTTKLVLDGQGKLTVANLELTGLATGYLYATSGVVSIGATQPAPSDAPFLTVGPVSGLSAEVDVNAIGTTVAFASTTTEPIAIQRDDSDTNGIVQVCSMRRSTSGTAANNIGGRMAYEVENSAGAFPVAGYFSWRLTNATNGSEASELGWWTRTAGGALVKNMYLDGVGALTLVGSVTATGFVGTSLDTATSTTLTIGGTNASAIGFGHGTITLTLTGLTDSIYAGIAAVTTTGRSLRNTTASSAGVTVQKAPSDVWEGRVRVSGADRAMRFRFTLIPVTSGNLQAIYEYDTAGSGSYSTAYYYTTSTPGQFTAALVCSGFASTSGSTGFFFDTDGSGMYRGGSGGLQLASPASADPMVIHSDATGSTDPIRIWASGETKGASKYIVKFGDATTWTARSGIAGDGAFIGPRVIAAASTPTSSGGAVTFNLSTSQNVHHTTTEDTTVTISGGTEGQHGVIVVSQGGSGKTLTMPTNGIGVEYSNDITALGGGSYQTAIIDTTANRRTVLEYIILANGKAFIYSRAVANIP